ncbi:MAG TPA: RluA family pseudouridine synthase [Anaerolineae bacterium]|nr:RluA family pseudouridine synthase [Anaerolineae bacterium]
MSDEERLITLTAVGERLDQALVAADESVSRQQWQKLIKEGRVTIPGVKVKASLRLAEPVVATVLWPETAESNLVAEEIPLDILYEDDDILVVNKGAGMVVHPAVGHETGTLVNAVLAHCGDILSVGGEKRPGIVHRLDKETSGVMVVAKNDASLQALQAQFKERTVRKKYLALVEGDVEPAEALIDAPIGRDPKQRKRMAVIPYGSSARSREAQTAYKVMRRWGEHTLVACWPKTGRTHQIRVHMAFAGYPLVGDKVYGRRRQTIKMKRQFLHAAELCLTHPVDGREMCWEAPLPNDLQAVVTKLDHAAGEV